MRLHPDAGAQVRRLRGAVACQGGALVRGDQPVAEALAAGGAELQLLTPPGCSAAVCGARYAQTCKDSLALPCECSGLSWARLRQL